MQVVDTTGIVEVSSFGEKGLELGVPKHAAQGTSVIRADPQNDLPCAELLTSQCQRCTQSKWQPRVR